MMKATRILALTALTAALTTPATSQMGPMPVGPEIKALGAFIGEWDTVDTMVGMDGKKSTSKGKFFAKWACDGRYIHSSMTTKMPDMGTMAGTMMLTYDAQKKEYVSTWFDSMAPHSLKSVGTFKNGSLNVLSEEFEEGGMGKMKIRTTFTFTKPNEINFVLKMVNEQGEQEWMNSIWTRKTARRGR